MNVLDEKDRPGWDGLWLTGFAVFSVWRLLWLASHWNKHRPNLCFLPLEYKKEAANKEENKIQVVPQCVFVHDLIPSLSDGEPVRDILSRSYKKTSRLGGSG